MLTDFDFFKERVKEKKNEQKSEYSRLQWQISKRKALDIRQKKNYDKKRIFDKGQ